MMAQFRRFKEQYPGALLLFRVGAFYETFNDDAVEVSRLLNITLTKRGDDPMAGFPHHALDNYLPKLVRKGKRVAICDQMEDVYKRQIVHDPVMLHENDTTEEVVHAFERYDLVAIPVVDSIGRLVGVITVDDVVDEMRDLNEKDYQLASGLSQDVESSDTVTRQIGARLPWLMLGMVGGVLNSMILGNYDTVFASVPAVSLFIPLMGGTGGNVGMQS